MVVGEAMVADEVHPPVPGPLGSPDGDPMGWDLQDDDLLDEGSLDGDPRGGQFAGGQCGGQQRANQQRGAGPEAVRLTAWVRGRVQGVGFRWWVRSRALELGLCGWAENLADGRVKVVVEGARDNCEQLLDRLSRTDTPGHVAHVTHRWDLAAGGLAGFAER
jgi:acylphosphatase